MNKVYINVDELLKDLLDYKVVINVQSQEQGKEFVKVMRDKFNMGWSDRSYDDKWKYFHDNTCYDFEDGANHMTFYELKCYKDYNKQIIPYSQVRELLVSNSTNNNDSKVKTTNKVKGEDENMRIKEVSGEVSFIDSNLEVCENEFSEWLQRNKGTIENLNKTVHHLTDEEVPLWEVHVTFDNRGYMIKTKFN